MTAMVWNKNSTIPASITVMQAMKLLSSPPEMWKNTLPTILNKTPMSPAIKPAAKKATAVTGQI